MRALVGSIRRKSRAMVWREISPRAPASSTPVGPPPMTTNVRSASCSADLQRVLQGLEPRSQYLPVVVAKISVAGARCEDERVVAELAPIERELAVGEIHLFDPREEDRDVGGLAQDGPQRGRNVGWIQRGGGHLREQRLEEMVVTPVGQGDPHGLAGQLAGGVQSAEAAAHDHHVRKGGRSGHRRIL